jgi:hypothetical protein
MVFTKTQIETVIKKLREIALVLEEASKTIQATNTQKSKRGRKPGSVPDEIRCSAEVSIGNRCKNRAVNNGVCGKHIK